jgi:hypothetical protein
MGIDGGLQNYQNNVSSFISLWLFNLMQHGSNVAWISRIGSHQGLDLIKDWVMSRIG